MEDNMKAVAAGEDKITIGKGEFGKTFVQIVSGSPLDTQNLFCDAVTSVVEHQQCPPDAIVRAVHHGLMNSDVKVRLSNEKESRISNFLFRLSTAALAGALIYSTITQNMAMAALLALILIGYGWERFRYHHG